MDSSQHERNFIKKLIDLQPTQQSINSLGLWIMYHAKRCKESVELWKREAIAAPPERKLTLLYLANDVMQNSRKKTQDFVREFGDVLYEVVESVWPRMNDKDRRSLARMLNIWEDRGLFPSAFIRSLKKIADVSALPTAKREEPSTPPGSPPKKQKRAEAKSQVVDDASKTVLSHPVVQALTELEKHRAGKKEEENVKRMFETAAKNMSEEQALGAMNMTDLQALRDKYESHIKQLSDFCNRCTRENSRRSKLITELHRYEKNQKEKQVQLNQKIQEWNKNMISVQNFVTKIEIKINQKKMERSMGSDKAQKRSHADTIDSVAVGEPSTDELLAQAQKRHRSLEYNPNPNPFMSTLPTSAATSPNVMSPYSDQQPTEAFGSANPETNAFTEEPSNLFENTLFNTQDQALLLDDGSGGQHSGDNDSYNPDGGSSGTELFS